MQGLQVYSDVLMIYVNKRLIFSVNAKAEINIYFIDAQIRNENFFHLFSTRKE